MLMRRLRSSSFTLGLLIDCLVTLSPLGLVFLLSNLGSVLFARTTSDIYWGVQVKAGALILGRTPPSEAIRYNNEKTYKFRTGFGKVILHTSILIRWSCSIYCSTVE